jgi:SAM-dependent methyltransferase
MNAARSIATFDETDFAGVAGGSSCREPDNNANESPAGNGQDGGEDAWWPYPAGALNRIDDSVDTNFYDQPRFVKHIDDGAIDALKRFYRDEFTSLLLQKRANHNDSGAPRGVGDDSASTATNTSAKDDDGAPPSLDVLDLCSSWISHLPEEDEDGNIVSYGRVVGVGMNRQELEANTQLTEFVVQDLNRNPSLAQFDDGSFDVICNVVSVDYLIQPLRVFREMHRILRPGGVALVSFSNRCFPTKAVSMWLRADDIGRLTIVASYYHYSARWSAIEALDLKVVQRMPDRPSVRDIFSNPALGLAWMDSASAVQRNNQGDPMYVVKGVK